MKKLTLTLLSLIATQSFASDLITIRTDVTCISSDPSRGSAAIYRDRNDNLIAIAVRPNTYHESALINEFHDTVYHINATTGVKHSGVFISKDGQFQMNMLKDGTCYAIVNGIDTSTPAFAIHGKPRYNSTITFNNDHE